MSHAIHCYRSWNAGRAGPPPSPAPSTSSTASTLRPHFDLQRNSDFRILKKQNFLCHGNRTENIRKPLRKPCMWYIKKVINYQYILGEWFLMSAIHEGATSCWASEGGWVGSTFLNHCFPSGKWCLNTPLTTSSWHDCNYCNSFIDSVDILYAILKANDREWI